MLLDGVLACVASSELFACRYHLYPLGLVLLQVAFLVFPSSTLSYKARRQVLGALFTVLKAG